MSPAKLKLNLVLLYGGEGLAKIFSVVAWGYVGHTLTSGPYGLLALPLTVYFVANQLLDAGLAPVGAREASRHPARTQVLAARIAWIRLGLVAVSLPLLFLLGGVLTSRPDTVRLLIWIYGAALLPMPFLVNWAFEARDEMHVVAWGTLLRQVVFAGSVLLLVQSPEDVLFVPLCEAAGLVVQALVHQVSYRRRGFAFLPLRGRRGAGALLRTSLPLGASTIFSALRWFAPLLVLSAVVEDSALAGYHESVLKIVVSLHTFVWLYFVNLLPSMSRLAAAGDRESWRRLSETSVSLVAWTVLPTLLIGTALAPLLVPLIYGETFGPAVEVFQVLVWMILAAFLSGHHRYGLIAHRKQRAEMSASLAGVAVSAWVAIALVLVGALTPLTAAAAVVLGELATLLAAGRLLRLEVGPVPWLRDVVPALLPTAAALAVWRTLAPGNPVVGVLVVLGAFGLAALLLRPRCLRPGARGPHHPGEASA